MSLAQDDLFSVILQLQHLAGGERSNAALYIGRSLVDEDVCNVYLM